MNAHAAAHGSGDPAWEGDSSWNAGAHADPSYQADHDRPDQDAVVPGDTTFRVLSHLGAYGFYVFPFFGDLIIPFVIWITKGRHDPAVERHARASLNFQITVWLMKLLCLPLTVILIGIPALVILFAIDLFLPVVAAIRASKGKEWRYPLDFELIKPHHLDRIG